MKTPLMLALCAALIGTAAAQDSRLETLEREIKERETRRDELEARAGRLQRENEALRARLIALADTARRLDTERDRLEARINDLTRAHTRLHDELTSDRISLMRVLAGLQALQSDPPPAFAVHPDDALDAVRGAIALAGVVPTIRAEADRLRGRLTELAAIQRRVQSRRDALARAEAQAETTRTELAAALAQKAESERDIRAKAARETAAVAALVREAQNLQDLAARLHRHTARAPAPALPDSSPFTAARGLVPLPVAGRIATRFGARDDDGVRAHGLTISARGGAAIIAPYDAHILYAGPFRRYGNILILGLNDGYQMVLTGLGRIDGFAGQQVLAGEPIGALPSGVGSNARSRLYMELRHRGRPIDPSPWIGDAGRNGNERG